MIHQKSGVGGPVAKRRERRGHLQRTTQLVLLAALLLAPRALKGQSSPVSGPPNSSLHGAAAAGEMSAEEIFRRFASRTLFLTCQEPADESALASGVLVSADGFIVTNAHVVERCLSMTATHISGKSRRSYEPQLKYYDEKTDTAVLTIADQGLDFFTVLPRPVRIGERVYAIGNPRGLEQSISEGIVSGDRDEDGASWIQHSAPISPGSSGGALISSRGELLGINSRSRRESQNLNFAVPATTLAWALIAARTRAGILEFPPNASAQLRLAQMYHFGEGVPQDYAEAAKWFRRAAEQGDPEAQASLGGAYRMGRGVPQDYAQAVAWFRTAAEQGLPTAQCFLALMYEKGEGVQQDSAQAAAWYRKAAEQGDSDAQLELGFEYLLGDGVPKDYSESYFWVKLAAEGKTTGVTAEQIGSVLDSTARQLTAAALSQVQEQVRHWLAAHPTAQH